MTAVLEALPQLGSHLSFHEPPPPRLTIVDREEDVFDMPACIRRVREGDEEAARALMNRLYPLVTKLVRAYRSRRTAEEDLIQTVFMKIFTRLRQYSGLVPIERWVSRVTVNTCLNQLQSEKIRPEWSFSELSENQQRFLETLAAPAEPRSGSATLVNDIVSRLLGLLKPADRLVVQLLHIEEKSILEIARITGWSVPVIKVRAFRARQKLKKHLRALEPGMSASFTA